MKSLYVKVLPFAVVLSTSRVRQNVLLQFQSLIDCAMPWHTCYFCRLILMSGIPFNHFKMCSLSVVELRSCCTWCSMHIILSSAKMNSILYWKEVPFITNTSWINMVKADSNRVQYFCQNRKAHSAADYASLCEQFSDLKTVENEVSAERFGFVSIFLSLYVGRKRYIVCGFSCSILVWWTVAPLPGRGWIRNFLTTTKEHGIHISWTLPMQNTFCMWTLMTWTLLNRTLFFHELKVHDELWNNCQSGRTVKIMVINEYTDNANGTNSLSFTLASLINECDKWHAVFRNQWSYMGTSTGVGWAYTGKRNFLLQGHVMNSSKISASTNLIWKGIVHPLLCLGSHLLLKSVVHYKFACFSADGTLAVIPGLYSETAPVVLMVRIVDDEKERKQNHKQKCRSRKQLLQSIKKLVFWYKIYVYLQTNYHLVCQQVQVFFWF